MSLRSQVPSEHHRVTFPSYCAVLFLVKLGLVWQVSSKCSCKDGRGFSRIPPGGWGFFSAILGKASKNKTPTPWGFSQVSGLKRCFRGQFYSKTMKTGFLGRDFFLVILGKASKNKTPTPGGFRRFLA